LVMEKNLRPEILKHMYWNLVLARRYEEKLCELFSQGKIPGWIHSGLGQEATGVAIGECLKREDYLVPYFRSRSSLIAKGLDLARLTAEILGKKTGCCQGRSGEAHIAEPYLGIIGAGGIIGSPIPIAVGLGYACYLTGKEQVVVCGFGDGATSRGSFHESINMAAVTHLPVVFVCENNLYAEFSPQAVQMNIKDIYKRADAYGIPGVSVDGNDLLAVYEIIEEAVQRARAGEGPTLVESRTYRWHGHFEGDACKYRPEGELEAWQKKDPLPFYQNQLMEMKVIDSAQAEEAENKIREMIEKAFEFAYASPMPTREEIMEFVYA